MKCHLDAALHSSCAIHHTKQTGRHENGLTAIACNKGTGDGGPSYGDENMLLMLGGSGGGGGSDDDQHREGAGGGGSGGAILIKAASAITIAGRLSAAGGMGGKDDGGTWSEYSISEGGDGGDGRIKLEGVTVEFAPTSRVTPAAGSVSPAPGAYYGGENITSR